MQHRLFGAVACALSFLAVPAVAAPVTVSAGQSVLFNFSGTAPVGTDSVSVRTNLSASTPDVDGLYTFYPDLDGGGSPWSLTGPIGLNVQDIVPSGPGAAPAGFLDGTFSMLLAVTQGSITIDPSATLFTTRDVGTVYRVTIGDVPPTTVDEPSGIALLAALGLGIAASRRRPPTSVA